MSKHSSRGKDWERTRKRVLERDNYTCQLCDKGEPATQVDHVVPKVSGGSDKPSNLVAASKACNLRKGAKVFTRSTYVDTDWFPNEVLDSMVGSKQ